MTEWIIAGVAVLAAAVGGVAYGRAWGKRHQAGQTERVRSELSHRLEELHSLQEFAYVVSESLKLEHIVNQAARLLVKLMRADGALVALTNVADGPLLIAAAEGCLRNQEGRELSESETGMLGQAMGQEHLEVAHIEGGRIPELMSDCSAHVVAVAPLIAHGVTIGALAAVRERDDPFGAGALRQLSTVASHTAIVVQNARFFDLIKAGKEQWEATVDALAEGIAVLDEQGLILRANRALAEMANQPIPAVIGRKLDTLLGGQRPALDEYITSVRDGQSPPHLALTSNDLGRTLRIAAFPMSGTEGSRLVVLVEDATERETMEAQLIQHEKMAAIGQLVSGVAHELNNPLSSITGLADFLLGREATGEQDAEYLQVIQEQADRAGRIVRNLLAFARKEPAAVSTLDLNDIVRRTVSLIGYDVKITGIDLRTNLADGLLQVRGDRHELQQVILNLLTNAVQAVGNSPGGTSRTVSVLTAPREDTVELRVTDSGPGIPSAALSQIFDPFFTTKSSGEGTGLGLSITHRIVKNHGGTISARNLPTGGSEFLVQLPMADDNQEGHNDQTGAASERPAAPSDVAAPRQRTILLVDDDPAVLRSLELLLTGEGHLVECTESATQALQLLRKHQYDLIIAEPTASLDEGAPFADALVRELPQLAPQTLFLSADVRAETEAWLSTLGCRYQWKPLSPDQLRAIVAGLDREGRGTPL